MGWMISEADLDPEQRHFRDEYFPSSPRNIWLQGHAGSGKSILLLYAVHDTLVRDRSAAICVVLYTHAMIDLIRTGFNELELQQRFGLEIPVMTYFEFRKQEQHYDYIFVDEVQDIPHDDLVLMHSRAKHVLVAGDEAQAIYEKRVEPHEISALLGCETYRLTIIHRLSRTLINIASAFGVALLRGKRDATKEDVEVRLGRARSADQETEYVWKQALQAVNRGESAVVLLPTAKKINAFAKRVLEYEGSPRWEREYGHFKGKLDYDSLNAHLAEHDVHLEYIGSTYGSLEHAGENRNVILMTYHSAKGLDFEHVFLPRMSDGLYIAKYEPETVMFVAVTRSRRNLYILYTGELHPFAERFRSYCKVIDVEEEIDALDEDAGLIEVETDETIDF
jgi:superfamily I DNA/RNA helicase